jgi:hypothetical protein
MSAPVPEIVDTPRNYSKHLDTTFDRWNGWGRGYKKVEGGSTLGFPLGGSEPRFSSEYLRVGKDESGGSDGSSLSSSQGFKKCLVNISFPLHEVTTTGLPKMSYNVEWTQLYLFLWLRLETAT